ncbi:hypothetical protein VJ786_02215 [Sphingobacterium sp. PU5-4]|uniref:Uncharacterized protein n=1 Tax=Sphingobacterium tenebrionis TaxID=3111775 RepID=A0ABU8I1V7_9SPHI
MVQYHSDDGHPSQESDVEPKIHFIHIFVNWFKHKVVHGDQLPNLRHFTELTILLGNGNKEVGQDRLFSLKKNAQPNGHIGQGPPYNGLVLRISQFKLTINHDYTKFTRYDRGMEIGLFCK